MSQVHYVNMSQVQISIRFFKNNFNLDKSTLEMSITILRNVFYLGEQCVNKWLLRVKWCGKIEKIKEKLNRKREIPKLKYYPNAFIAS